MSTPNPIPIIDPAKASVAWVDPTLNKDGSAVSATEITSYTVGVRDTTATGSTAGSYPFSVTAPSTTTHELISLLAPALPKGVALVASVKANTATAADPSLPSSDWAPESAAFQLPVPPPVPVPPTGVSVG